MITIFNVYCFKNDEYTRKTFVYFKIIPIIIKNNIIKLYYENLVI